MDVRNKAVIVTGGASGLGEAAVREFAAAGAQVMMFDQNEQRAATILNELGPRVAFQKVNVAMEADVQRGIAETVKAFGALHVCLNCAGIGVVNKTYSKRGPFPLDDFKKVIEVNLVGTFNCARLAAEQMAKNPPEGADKECGVIINTASAAAFEGQKGQVAYSASKGGIVGMTLPMTRDLASYGIRVMTIAPGLMFTPAFHQQSQDVIDALVACVQFPKRLGHAHEFARLVRHIVENSYFNGDTLRIDAGTRMP